MTDSNPPESASLKTETRRLLPRLVTHPLTMLVTVAVPQLILLILNLRSYHLLSEEVDDSQKKLAVIFFMAELAILISGCLFTLWQSRRSDRIPWGWNWLIFVPAVVYLSFFTTKIYGIVPAALQLWIVVPETLIFYQFVFMMPAIFLSALGLACFPIRLRRGQDIGASLGLALGIPLVWYLLLHVGHGSWIEHLPGTLIFLFVAASSLICLTGVLRLITLLFTWALEKGQLGQSILIAIVSIVAPIGGLLLNRAIPFPADLQTWPVYTLTILNGILLTVPRFHILKLDRVIWLLQCALFPFTLYFFFIFLPYLPLAAIAIIAAGSGFLILSPTALFLIHLRKLHQGSPERKLIPFGILAALILPAYAQVEMIIDRAVLHQAINYVYSPNLESDGQFNGSRVVLKRSLSRLQKVKNGVYLPFLTEWYNECVLNGLVLSDEKLNHIHYTFFGRSMPVGEDESIFGFGMAGNRNNRAIGGTRMVPPPQSAVLKEVTHSTSTDPTEGTRTLVKLELHNPSKVQSEFATTIDIPEGVFVSGYWLLVGDERVPGQIFEKKTAMWIYRMIRDASRRDPGLLTYLSPHQLSLRVFPFAAGETRITEIEFLSPPGYSPELRIGKETIAGKSGSENLMAIKSDDANSSFFLSAEAAGEMPATNREPYFHFIVDRSSEGLTEEEAITSMEEVAAEFPAIKNFTVSPANYEFVNSIEHLRAIAELKSEATSNLIESLPLRGAFLAEQSLQRCLSRFRIRQAEAENTKDLLQYPLFVLIESSDTPERIPKELMWYRSATPDVDGYFIKYHGAKSVDAKQFSGEKANELQLSQPVLILSSGESNAVVSVEDGPSIASFRSGETIKVYDPSGGEFHPIQGENELPAMSAYSKAIDAQRIESRIRWNPARTDDLITAAVSTSRETGILTPSTAYIVVESSAQWKMLKRKEKEKLQGNQALDFMEAPEPYLPLIIVAFGVFLWLKKRIHRLRVARQTSSSALSTS